MSLILSFCPLLLNFLLICLIEHIPKEEKKKNLKYILGDSKKRKKNILGTKTISLWFYFCPWNIIHVLFLSLILLNFQGKVNKNFKGIDLGNNFINFLWEKK